MNRIWQILTTTIILIIIIILGIFPILSGLMLRQNFSVILDRLSEPNNWTLREIEFNRGWFNSEARSIFTVQGDLAKHLQSLGYSNNTNVPLQLTLNHHIQHGPVLDMGNPWLLPAVSLINTNIENQNDSQLIKALFKNQSFLQLKTLIRFSGEIINRIQSPPAQGQLTQDIKINWQGIEGNFQLENNLNKIHGKLNIPLLSITDKAGEVNIEQFGMNIDYQHHQSGLWLGDIDLTLQKLNYLLPGKSNNQFTLSGLTATSSSNENQERLNALIAFDLINLAFADYPLGSSGFTIELNNIDLLSFVTLYNHLKYLDRQTINDDNKIDDELKKIIIKQLPTLIRHSPEIMISRLDIKTPRGIINGKFKMNIINDNDHWDAASLEILQHLGIELAISASSNLVKELFQTYTVNEIMKNNELNENMESEKIIYLARNTAEKYLDNLVREKLLINSSDRYSTQAKYLKGDITINGYPRNELLGIFR